jgi:hypothetical protein
MSPELFLFLFLFWIYFRHITIIGKIPLSENMRENMPTSREHGLHKPEMMAP